MYFVTLSRYRKNVPTPPIKFRARVQWRTERKKITGHNGITPALRSIDEGGIVSVSKPDGIVSVRGEVACGGSWLMRCVMRRWWGPPSCPARLCSVIQ